MMAAVHQQPIQLYDNIITLTGGTGSGAGSPTENGDGSGNTNATITTTVTESFTGGCTSVPNPVTGNVAKWGQCGGLEYKGSTTCAAGLACIMLDPYYYQCLAQAGTVYRRR